MAALIQRTWRTVSGLGCGVLVGFGTRKGQETRGRGGGWLIEGCVIIFFHGENRDKEVGG